MHLVTFHHCLLQPTSTLQAQQTKSVLTKITAGRASLNYLYSFTEAFAGRSDAPFRAEKNDKTSCSFSV